MNSLRVWIIVLVVTTFLGGTAAGRILAHRELAPRGERAALQDFEELFVAQFELAPERAGFLRGILAEYHRDIEKVKETHLAAYRTAIEPELRELGLKYNDRLRDMVLPPSSRAEFADLSRGHLLNHPSR